jgi:hypothetical protein
MKAIRAWKFALPIGLLVLMAGCSKESSQTQPVTTRTENATTTAAPAKDAKQRDKALVRIVNAVPTGPTFDLYTDDKKVFAAVAFKTVTPYQEIPDEHHSFRLRPAGQDSAQPVVEEGETLTGGKHYTLIVMPDTNDKIKLQVVNDNLVPPPADKAEVRVIQASPDAGEVDVVAKQGNKKLFSGVNAGSDTRYTDLEPMNSTLEIRPEGKDNALASMPNTKFDKGKIYTIVVAGSTKGTPKLQAVVIEDHIGTRATASLGEQESPQAVADRKLAKSTSKY